MVIKLAPGVIQYDSISSGAISFTSPGGLAFFNAAENELRFIMVNANPSSPLIIPANEPLFYIHLKSNQTVQLEDVIQLVVNDPETPSLLMGAGCTGGFQMRYAYAGFVATHAPLAPGILLNPPSPNPFTDHSWLDLNLDQTENVLLEISDLTGRILYAGTRQFDPGITRWDLPAAQIPSGSMCIWRLVIDGKSATGKLVRR